MQFTLNPEGASFMTFVGQPREGTGHLGMPLSLLKASLPASNLFKSVEENLACCVS